MTKTGKVVAWICIANLPLAGCYSSAVIDPRGPAADKMRTQQIAYVTTKDLTKYEFNYSAPEVTESYIVGVADFPEGKGRATWQVALPFTNISEVGVKEFRPVETGFAVVGIPLAIVGVYYAVAMAIFAANGGLHFN
jgi:hypothetical protein